MKALFLLDGYALVYRSYFAFLRTPLVNSQGRNVSAMFGFFRTLLAFFEQYKPECFAVAMDSAVPTFRHDQYAEYKATRDKTPEELHDQVPTIEEILAALRVPVIRVDTFEADDVIATLAERCRSEGRPCYVVSGDKDLLQLVGGPVKVLRPGKGDYEEIGAEEVRRDWEVGPEQILDYLALIGDASDNVPGVRGIGPKSAAKLLRDFGTLDGVYRNLEKLPAAQKAKLAEDRENAYLSRRLITLRTDVPLPRDAQDPDSLGVTALALGAAAPLFQREGLKALAVQATAKADEPAAEKTEEEPRRGTYETILDVKALDRWIALAKKRGLFAFDSETTSIDAVSAEPVGFSLSVRSGEACYIPLKAAGADCLPADTVRERLRSILEDRSLKIVGQNIKYDLKVLKRWGVTLAPWFDTMIAAWLVDSTRNTYNMDDLAAWYLDYTTIHYEDVVPKDSTFDAVDLDQATQYAAEDADVTFRLYEKLEPLLRESGLEKIFYEVEMPLIPVLADMELAGIRLLPGVLKSYSKKLGSEIARIEERIHGLCGGEFNINSTKQLQEILFTKLGLKHGKKTKTGYSTDTGVLEELAAEPGSEGEVPRLVLRYRLLSKLKSTYVDTLPTLINPETGRIHTNFVQTGAATGRLASKDPNLQNIPIRDEEGRHIREAFVPAEGTVFVSADYAQIELVVLAHLSGDPGLRSAFAAGKDVHAQTGSLIFGVPVDEVSPDQRRIAKTINFGVMYGMSAFRLSRELSIPRAVADQFIGAYFEQYSAIKRFIETTTEQTKESGYARTLLGRRRPVPGIDSRNHAEQASAQRVAVNTPIQGSAADIVKLAMLRIAARFKKDKIATRMLLQVHDELIFEAPEIEATRVMKIVREEMESAVKLDVPLRVSVESGGSWGDLH